tara:strand:+ start:324 stop:458 length:135 start_codon:yes stop_codon:yes gene_type:complete
MDRVVNIIREELGHTINTTPYEELGDAEKWAKFPLTSKISKTYS